MRFLGRSRVRLAGVAVVAAAALAAGCATGAAGHLAADQAFVEYRPGSQLFTVRVPQGWSRTEQDAVVTFSDRFNRVRIETAARPTPPDVASLAADLGAVQAQATGFSGGAVTVVDHPVGRVWRAEYRADAPPDPAVKKAISDDFERYQFWRDGQLVLLTLSAPHGANNGAAWRTVADSFRWSR